MTSRNGGLDPTDRRLLALLADDGRATLQALGDAIGLRRPAVHQRLKRLERSGVVRGYRADLDPASVGAGLVAFATLRIATSAKPGGDCLSTTEQVAKALLRIPEVLEFHSIAGSDDALVKLRVADVAALQRLAMRELSAVPGVERVSTTVVLATHFERPVRVAAGKKGAR